MPGPRYGRRWSISCLVGGLILVAGSASPEPIVEPAQLDKRLAGTPLAGLGAYFLSEGSRFQIDPRLVVAIAGAESSFGGRICTPFNAWNWFWEGPCRPRRPDGSTPSPFRDWERGIEVVSKFLKKSYVLKGYTTIPQIGSKYCAEGCKDWEPNVTEFYSKLGGDLSDLTYAHVVPPPGGTEKPIDTGTVESSSTITNPSAETKGKEKPIDTTVESSSTKAITNPSAETKGNTSSDAKASAGESATESPLDSRPAEGTGLPAWLWAVLGVALAGLSGAAGFALGRLTRHSGQ